MTTTYHRHESGHADLAALAAEDPPLSRLALAAFAVAALAALMVALAGPGSRLGWWHFGVGFSLLKWGAYLGILGALACLVALFRTRESRGRITAVVGLVLALGAVLVPWSFGRGARGAPPIHDITTDVRNPPAFVAIAPIRAREGATNPSAYEGEAVAAQQQKAYPDIQPVMLALPISQAYDEALAAARDMGWRIVAENSDEGRIEATDQTRWFGFKDDVVIRVMPASGVSRVDVRSVSRVGKGDTGTNAQRIRDYLERLKSRAPVASQG
ncbi:MAG: DUF1499 domain-containing protein [Gemmatimonadetes bacterium]|nr:DUF1499 domain-containing protein [Gemmatimonadota bacterium]